MAARRALKGLLNPLRDVSQLELCLCSTLWMGRIAISNFLIKIAVKRVVSRSVMRKSLPFVAIIGTAVWNALTARALMAEARVRAMGVSSASEIADLLLEHYVRGELSKVGKLQVVRAVACIVVQCVSNQSRQIMMMMTSDDDVRQTDDEVQADPLHVHGARVGARTVAAGRSARRPRRG